LCNSVIITLSNKSTKSYKHCYMEVSVMTNRERSELIEWIVLIEQLSYNELKNLSDEEIQKKYSLALLSVADEINFS